MLQRGAGTQNTSQMNNAHNNTRDSISARCSNNLNIFAKSLAQNSSNVPSNYGKEQKLILRETFDKAQIDAAQTTASLRPSEQVRDDDEFDNQTPSHQRRISEKQTRGGDSSGHFSLARANLHLKKKESTNGSASFPLAAEQ